MKQSEAKGSTLIVGRLSDRDIKMREMILMLDGSRIGTIRFGQSSRITISPGRHSLKATNGIRSQVAEFEVGTGQSAAFMVGNAPSGCFIAVLAVAGAGPPTVFMERADLKVAENWKSSPLKK